MSAIPFPNNAQWTQQIVLSGTPFLMSGQWNALNNYWTISFAQNNGTPIVTGQAVMINQRVSYQWEYAMRAINPAFGAIYCLSTRDSWNNIERLDMNNTCLLVYYTQAELA